MANAKQIVEMLFAGNNVSVPPNRAALFDKFLENQQNIEVVNSIIDHYNLLMDKWKIENRIADIIQQPIRILNATVGKPYETKFDFDKFKWKEMGREERRVGKE